MITASFLFCLFSVQQPQRWQSVDLPEHGVSDTAKRRVSCVPPSLEVALETNRSALAADRATRKRKALKRLSSGDVGGSLSTPSLFANPNPLAGGSVGGSSLLGSYFSVFGSSSPVVETASKDGAGGVLATSSTASPSPASRIPATRSKSAVGPPPLDVLHRIGEEAGYCSVGQARAADMLDLVTKLLSTDGKERLSPAEAMAHPALSTSFFRTFM